ncbi:MAG TPA: translation initiation factor IF-2 [Candidatus Paceibacterota bacterium]|nr:translation initiation factor IF-2 [Candidatus Paceibacterota bacterium]
MTKRPPIVVVMGHVDHGKTTLLDYIRKTNVASREAGGITQAIGAYEIEHSGKKITFIDTPGHEAFSKMRAHGARVADLAILVVAADEGVKPQTEEALKQIIVSETPYIVAINKIDKAGANIEKVKQELAKVGVLLEGFGGSISWHGVSAKTGAGVNELLDLILLAAEIEDLSYDPTAPARGIVLTAHLDSRRGIVAGVVVTDGTLSKGSPIYTESASGKVKILQNFKGDTVAALNPSAPAMILGFEELPSAGEEFSTEKIERKVAGRSDAGTEVVPGAIKVVLKANESGSLDALEHVIDKIGRKTPITVVESGVGDIYEGDVKIAGTTGATVVGFRVKVDRAADNLAKAQKTEILVSDIIYELEKSLEEKIASGGSGEKRTLEVLAIFGEPRGKKQVVGGRIVEGFVRNGENFSVSDGVTVVGAGRVLNLQSGKKDVSEARAPSEVGLLVESDWRIKVGHKLVFG